MPQIDNPVALCCHRGSKIRIIERKIFEVKWFARKLQNSEINRCILLKCVLLKKDRFLHTPFLWKIRIFGYANIPYNLKGKSTLYFLPTLFRSLNQWFLIWNFKMIYKSHHSFRDRLYCLDEQHQGHILESNLGTNSMIL